MTQQIEAPALEHDAFMLKRFGTKVSPNGRLERRIVANMIAHLAAKGFAPTSVWDGEEDTPATDAKSVMELVFNLDEARVYFGPHNVLLVMGNGIDIISDWTYKEGDPDGFNAAMDAFDAEQYA